MHNEVTCTVKADNLMIVHIFSEIEKIGEPSITWNDFLNNPLLNAITVFNALTANDNW